MLRYGKIYVTARFSHNHMTTDLSPHFPSILLKGFDNIPT